MHNWDTSLQTMNNDFGWYGNMFPAAAIKSEPQSSPPLTSLMDHHNAFLKQAHSIEMNSLSPSPRNSDQSQDGPNSFFESAPSLTSNLLMKSQSHHPLGFNPLTPPGLPNAILPQMHYHSSQHSQNSQLQILQRNQQLKHQNENISLQCTLPLEQESLLQQQKIDQQPLTPSNTPPLDRTPPKSPNTFIEFMDKDQDLQSNSSELLESDNDEPVEVTRTPNYNSHGKMKQYKCKSCGYIAVTKQDFWKHTREHMKPEKIMQCELCEFVTELKHHLEYHKLKHNNLKPFRCDKCNYSCVNKSMLSSHAKSHSSVYQYRCSDCDYATKYCHSFKIHLRKYQHKPGMLLDEEGKPNPSIIIDVYGTRRGPKMKSTPHNNNGSRKSNSMKHESMNGIHNKPKVISPIKNDQSTLANNLQNFLPTPLANMLQQTHNMSTFFPFWNFQMLAQHQVLAQLSPRMRDVNLHSMPDKITLPDDASDDRDCKSEESVMDLSSGNGTPTKSNPVGTEQASEINNCSEEEINTPTNITINSSRRKGRVLKLENRDSSLSSEENSKQSIDNRKNLDEQEVEINLSVHENETVIPKDNTTAEHKSESIDLTNQSSNTDTNISVNSIASSLSPLSKIYECKYCHIYFKDAVLYTIHMGYHSCDDAFKCNMCGEKCDGPRGFFVHMTCNAHS